jgi:hypothetical protein
VVNERKNQTNWVYPSSINQINHANKKRLSLHSSSLANEEIKGARHTNPPQE